MDAKQRLEAAKNKLKQMEQARTVAETQLRLAQVECDEVLKEMASVGVSPDNIEEKIGKLDADIAENLKLIDTLMPAMAR